MKKYLVIICFFLCVKTGWAQKDVSIIPKPLTVSVGEGSYSFSGEVKIQAATEDEIKITRLLIAWLGKRGKSAEVVSGNAGIRLNANEKSISEPEGYKLKVDASGVTISASAGAGLFYGFQTLMQLPFNDSVKLNIPYVTISDAPAFKWRGSMLDVSRHFFSVEFLKKYLDVLAFYKINTFHWHLTDDQGWRIEIKRYPKLTQVGAFRKETLIGEEQLLKKSGTVFRFDGIPYGGYYTQTEIREIVSYAAERYITIVPEIEMPGHTVSVLAAYPELACKPGSYEVFTKWGVSEDIICPSEESVRFFENVLSEVVALFPGKYVHIGGDEAPKKEWKESEAVATLMKRNKIQEVEKVQGWFNSRIEKFLNGKGKKLIGWDEILEGGISPASTVMSWRGEVGGIEAARHGNDVVMAPHEYVYLDYGQHPLQHSEDEPIMICCYLPIEKIYSYNPLPTVLSPELHKHILGVQANLWTEYISTPNKVEYALFPRLLALSEVAWTPYQNKSFNDFSRRLSRHFALLDDREIYYRVPEPGGLNADEIKTTGERVTVTLYSTVPGAKVYYTLDGHTPNETTLLYDKPLSLPRGRSIRIRAVTITRDHRASVPVEYMISE